MADTATVWLTVQVGEEATERVDKATKRFHAACDEVNAARVEMEQAVHALRSAIVVKQSDTPQDPQ